MKNLCCIVFLSLICLNFASGQLIYSDTAHHVPKTHNIGLSASPLSGYGLAYRYALNSIFQIQLVGIALQTKEENNQEWFFGNIGSELQFTIPAQIGAFNIQRVFGFIGASYMYEDNKGASPAFQGQKYSPEESFYNAGIGIGFQSSIFSGTHIIVQGVYFYRHITRSQHEYVFNPKTQILQYSQTPLPSIREISLGLSVGAYFSF